MAVQPEQFAGYEELSRKIEAGTAAGRYIVAIDGRCGAGKSTLAQKLARDLGGRVVCADDFFLRPEQRTPERLAEPGGNLDRERMKSDVYKRQELCFAAGLSPLCQIVLVSFLWKMLQYL